jgi:hypothetical protein
MNRPKLDFEVNDTVQNIVVLTKKSGDYCYFFSDKEFWILEYWDAYVTPSIEEELEDTYFQFLQPFSVSYEELDAEAKRVISKGKEDRVKLNKPSLYVDFDCKVFYSQFYDQALENRLYDSWLGRFEPFEENVPKKLIYWQEDQPT